MTHLSLFTQNNNLLSELEQCFPTIKIRRRYDLYGSQETIWIVDCATLDEETIRQVVTTNPDTSYALVDSQTISQMGELLLETNTPIIKYPLNPHGQNLIRQAVTTVTRAGLDATETSGETYRGLASDYSLHADDLPRFTLNIAQTVREIMSADWVVFVSVAFDQNEDYSTEVLAMVGDVPEERANQIIRPHGLTLHIMKTKFPVVMPDINQFRLDGIAPNPHLLDAGFQAALGLPLLSRINEPVGVMWVMFRERYNFVYAEVRHLQVYASHVALAYDYYIQKKLVAQWQNAAQKIFARTEDNPTLDATLRQITRGIQNSLDCDVVTLYHYNKDTGQLDSPYDEGAYDPQALRRGDRVAPESLVYLMLDLPEPLILENAPADERFAQTAFLTRESIQAVVVMPLRHAGELVGVVFLNYRQKRYFTDDERTAITIFADQIAAAVLNAYLDEQQRQINQKNTELIEQIREQGEQLQTLVKVIDIERNLSNQDREAILKLIAKQTLAVAGADRVTIRLVHDDGVVALAIYPEDSLTGHETESWEIRDGGHSHYIVQTNQSVIIPDVDNYDPADYAGIKINKGWQGVWKARIGLPLTSGEKTIGVMWLSFKQAREVTQSQLSAFQSFANIAFLTKMYDIEQERLRNALKVMTVAHQEINTANEIDVILRQTTQLAGQIVNQREDVAACISYLAVVKNTKLVFLQEHNQPETHLLLQEKVSPDASIGLDDEPCLVAEVVRKRQTVCENDVSQNKHFLPLLHDTQKGSQLSVPIIVGDHVFAVITVEHAKPNSFEWYDQATIEWLASYAGQVIQNQLQQEMRHALFEASQAITASKDLETVLQTIAEQAYRVLAIKRGNSEHEAYVGLRENHTLKFFASYPQETLQNIRYVGLDQIDLSAEQIGISAIVLQGNDPELVHDIETDNRAFRVEESTAPRSLLSVPIPNLTDDQPALGVISLGHRQPHTFDAEDKKFMSLFAKFAAVAIRRAREIDDQMAQRESLFELTRAAMDQVIAAHDLNNFRMVYKMEFPQLEDHIATLLQQEEVILRSVNDSSLFDALEEALEAIPESLHRFQEAYASRINQGTQIPELGEHAPFAVREWLWSYHKEKNVHLQIESSVTDYHRSIIPKYWLREVIKILVMNARRALQHSGYIDSNGNTNQRAIQMQVAYNAQENRVEIRISNPGDPVPDELRPLLTNRVIPKSLRHLSSENGRGIGLFMSGIIMRAYDGDVFLDSTAEETTFILQIPLA